MRQLGPLRTTRRRARPRSRLGAGPAPRGSRRSRAGSGSSRRSCAARGARKPPAPPTAVGLASRGPMGSGAGHPIPGGTKKCFSRWVGALLRQGSVSMPQRLSPHLEGDLPELAAPALLLGALAQDARPFRAHLRGPRDSFTQCGNDENGCLSSEATRVLQELRPHLGRHSICKLPFRHLQRR